MTAQETSKFLASYNAWRRDDGDAEMPPPKSIGEAIDNAVRLLTEQEAEIARLQDLLTYALAPQSIKVAAGLDRLRELVRDKERLDWLDERKDTFQCTSHDADWVIFLPQARATGCELRLTTSVRAAIDAAKEGAR